MCFFVVGFVFFFACPYQTRFHSRHTPWQPSAPNPPYHVFIIRHKHLSIWRTDGRAAITRAHHTFYRIIIITFVLGLRGGGGGSAIWGQRRRLSRRRLVRHDPRAARKLSFSLHLTWCTVQTHQRIPITCCANRYNPPFMTNPSVYGLPLPRFDSARPPVHCVRVTIISSSTSRFLRGQASTHARARQTSQHTNNKRPKSTPKTKRFAITWTL